MLDLSYGENPHQRAAYYAERGARTHLLSRVEQLHGKALSFNNLNDLSAARMLAREFALPACVIVKHANPCGVAVGATLDEAYERALASDPTSAYGGIVVLNREVEEALGEQLAEQFVEVLFAPGYSDGALDALRRRQNTRILVDRERRHDVDARQYKRVLGGLLVQDPDADVEDREGWQVVVRLARREAVGRSRLRVAGVQARLLERDRAREGSRDDRDRRGPDEPRRRGATSPSRRRRAHGHDANGAVLASDAFFPFPGRSADRARRGRRRRSCSRAARAATRT